MPIKITDDDMDYVPGKEFNIVNEIDKQELENRLEELLMTLEDLTVLVQGADPSQYRHILPSIEFLKRTKAQIEKLLNYWLLSNLFELSKKRRERADKNLHGEGIDPGDGEISHHPAPPSESLAEN